MNINDSEVSDGNEFQRHEPLLKKEKRPAEYDGEIYKEDGTLKAVKVIVDGEKCDVEPKNLEADDKNYLHQDLTKSYLTVRADLDDVDEKQQQLKSILDDKSV